MANTDARLLPHSKEVVAACNEISALLSEFVRRERLIKEMEELERQQTRRRMPRARSLEEFMEGLRTRGYDDVFTSENPGP